ncbi:hypothetical protein VP01_799g2 [Puccinia sorghi]|uniref:Uncharacterized protein n=1 Tax=Puccinia sorghi TaxID=27349 RepID=A0A0L6UAN0_9BASI|nr:hypothetical protein VP01_799g2 [Puccinia sorghi]
MFDEFVDLVFEALNKKNGKIVYKCNVFFKRTFLEEDVKAHLRSKTNRDKQSGDSPWYPFLIKRYYLMTCLILGQLHSIMNHDFYPTICSILSTHNIDYPHWKILTRLKTRFTPIRFKI